MRVVMLYPFVPWEWHGGTLRLRTAAAACAGGHLDMRWWDPEARMWCGPLEMSGIGGRAPGRRSDAQPSGATSLKRALLPSTLLESGRHAVAAAPLLLRALRVSEEDTVILHTSYLSRLVGDVRGLGARAVIDIHDLVWRAHRADAATAPAAAWAPRALYALSVRQREERRLPAADRLLVAGYQDFECLRRLGARAAWAPTGVAGASTAASSMPPVRLGLIGNFAHAPTMDVARRLLDSPLARQGSDVRLVFAGLGSDALGVDGRAEVLGPVERIADFYERVNVVLAPFKSGAGMKCKLAEAALSGKTVITTPAGACGYSPALRAQLHVCADPLRLSPAAILDIARAHDAARARELFAREVGFDAAVAKYRDALR